MWSIPNRIIVFNEEKPLSCGDSCPFSHDDCLYCELQNDSEKISDEEKYGNCPVRGVKNPTNGDVIKASFPDLVVSVYEAENRVRCSRGDIGYFVCDLTWWNEPFKVNDGSYHPKRKYYW